MKTSVVACVSVLLAAGFAVGAEAPVAKLLSPGDVNPALLVAPPRADDSAESAIEREELRHFLATRTPQRLALAIHDAEVEDVTAIASALGGTFDLQKLPATQRLFADMHNEQRVVSAAAKANFHRSRPWEVDSVIGADSSQAKCGRGATHTSYPSGHALMGFSAGGLLAQLLPAKADRILERAREYGESRLICGVHFRSDIVASQVLAANLVAKLMDKPAFRAEFAEAQAELVKAGF